MPIYEYQCSACGHQLEAMQKISEAALTDCPACGKSALKKLISAAGFQLKGKGWYATDFKGGGQKDKAAASEGSSADADKSASTTDPKKAGGCGHGSCGCAH